MKEKQEYKGWLNSTNFFKRALAVYGHALFINIIIMTSFLLILSFIDLSPVDETNTYQDELLFQGPTRPDTDVNRFTYNGESEVVKEKNPYMEECLEMANEDELIKIFEFQIIECEINQFGELEVIYSVLY